MKEVIRKINPCKSCLCIRCNSLLCPYEKFYNCYPTNPSCIKCLMDDNDRAITDCKFFTPRTTKHIYKIRVKRRDPYKNIAKLLASLHTEFKRLK